MNWIEFKKTHKKANNFIWVECIVEIKNNITKEIREYETAEILEIGKEHPSVFIWQYGNYSCDCNRSLFFKRAKDKDAEDDFFVECSDGMFSVNLKNKKNGKRYYEEYVA